MPHPHASPDPIFARCGVITLSDTRTESTDLTGQLLRTRLAAAGHSVLHYQILPDDPARLDAALTDVLARPELDLLLTNGGTGISPRDQTIPVVTRHLAAELPGFGELFRSLSYQQVGPAAMLSRAVGGITRSGIPLFAVPGSPAAAELALDKLILPEIPHLLRQLDRR